MRINIFLFRRNLLLLPALFSIIILQAQTTKVDIFKKQVRKANNNAEKLTALMALLKEAYSLERDTLFYYASEAKKIATVLHDENNLALADYYNILFVRREGYSDSCLRMTNQLLHHLSYQHSRDIYSKFKLLQIDIISESGDSKDGIDSAFSFLKVAENASDTGLQMQIKSRIGSMYSDIGQYSDGLNWLYKAQNTSLDLAYDNLKNNAVLFFNIGLDYNYLGKFDSADVYADKTISVSKTNENLTMLAYGLGLKSFIYSYTNRAALAEKPMNESVQLLKQIGSLYSVINVMSAQAKYYLSVGHPDKGIEVCLEALDLIKKYPIVPKEIIYDQLAENYRAKDDFVKYAETLSTIIRLKDSTYKKNSAEALAAMNAKYEVSNKEAFIAKQKLELLHKDILIASVAVAAFFILAAAVILFRRYRRRHIMAIAEAEEKEHKRIAADLHDNIGAYASAISANIDEISANRSVSDSMLTNLKNNATEIITSLRDTIWAFNKESVTLTGISDRIKIYVHKIQPSYPQININMEENINDDKRFSPVQALHLFRIIQEAVNNAIRHSHCGNITILIESNHENISMNIKDDGDGFDLQKADSTGNGLTNMRTRARESGFLISFGNASPKGTDILLKSK